LSAPALLQLDVKWKYSCPWPWNLNMIEEGS
jgi:hypothetical protein